MKPLAVIPSGSAVHAVLRMPLLLIAGLIATSLAAQENSEFNEAVDRLNRMSVAMSQMTYQGTFVYVQGSLVETMRITHVVDDDGIHERLVAETGRQRELWRDSSGVQWIAKDSREVVLDPALNRSYFPEMTAGDLKAAANHYEISLGGLEPLAGRLGRQLNIVPRDEYRYGYTLWLEDPSCLLLKWEIYEQRARPLARLMFTDIRVGQEVDLDELRASNAMDGFQTHLSKLPEKQEITRAKPRWAPAKLPPGFKLTAHRRQQKQAADLFQHLVYSDGIATVSVYVEPAIEGQQPPQGTSRLGTTHAFSRHSEGMQITVVGDVPAITVREIGMSVAANAP